MLELPPMTGIDRDDASTVRGHIPGTVRGESTEVEAGSTRTKAASTVQTSIPAIGAVARPVAPVPSSSGRPR